VKALWVTDRASCGPARFEALLAALAGAPGLTVSLREKAAADREQLLLARQAREALGPAVRLTVNRRFDIALAAGAGGVQLPADGLPLSRVRAEAPRGFAVGVSTHSPEEAAEAIAAGADLVVLGPIFETPSKRAFGPPLGPEALDRLPPLAEHGSEVYAIGGVTPETLGAIARRGDRVTGIAAIRFFQDAAHPRAALEAVRRL